MNRQFVNHHKLADKQINMYRKYRQNMKEYHVTYWKWINPNHRTLSTIVTTAVNKMQAYHNIKLMESDSGLGYKTQFIRFEK